MRVLDICELIILVLILIFVAPLLGPELGPDTTRYGIIAAVAYYVIGFLMSGKK